jgi:hypothetical protein
VADAQVGVGPHQSGADVITRSYSAMASG